jgi:hypothetical protein
MKLKREKSEQREKKDGKCYNNKQEYNLSEHEDG